jgi:hypothetical protein
MNERQIERKFYHDLLNLAASARGISDIITEVDEKTRSEMLVLLGSLSETMIETINLRRLYCGLLANDIKTTPCPIDCEKLLNRLAQIYSRHTLSENKTVCLLPVLKATPSQKITVTTDKDILQGTLGYGIRTALESSPAASTITLGLKTISTNGSSKVLFSLTFPGSISEEEKAKVFKRPDGEAHGLMSHTAYIFHALVTEVLRGSLSWTRQGGSVTLEALFAATVKA